MDYKILKEKLKELNFKEDDKTIGDSTIRKYILAKLVPQPEVRSLGRGNGRQSEYPEEALGQIYAAWKLLNGPIRTQLPILTKVRKIALQLLELDEISIESSVPQDLEINWSDLSYIMELWINYCEQVKSEYVKYRVDIKVSDNQGVATITAKFPRTRPRNKSL